MERAKGFEPSTSCLGSKHSTTELHPLRDVAACMYYITVNSNSNAAFAQGNSIWDAMRPPH